MDPIIADALLRRPGGAALALHPEYARTLRGLLGQRADAYLAMPRPAPNQAGVGGGIAVVPVQGVLTHDECCWWGMTGYGEIRAMVAEAVASADVRAIVLHIDSPGGTVAGCFDLVDALVALRGTKPIWAIVDEMAASAAYAIASAADRILVPRTGLVGSIGVVAMHTDVSAMLDQAGIKVTTVQYGARKTDSYPTTPLSDEARVRMQAEVDAMGELFVAIVATNRKLDPDRVRATEAATFLGPQGVELGLADQVASADDAFLSLLADLG